MSKLRKVKDVIRKNKVMYNIMKIPYAPFKIYCRARDCLRDIIITKENSKVLNELKISKENIFYFGIPRHLNIGDMAQTYSTIKWINMNYPNKNLIMINTAPLMNRSFINRLKKKVTSSNLIFIQSGYCSHEKHPDHKMHKKVVKMFPDNKIVILPQTVNIQNNRELKRTANIYNNHNKLIFISRDHVSHNMIKDAFYKTKLLVYPDIVNTLIGTMVQDSQREGVLLCLRNDFEKYYDDSIISNYLVSDLCMFRNRIDRQDTTISGYSYDYFYNNFDVILQDTLNSFASYEVIITDRYHGTIFAAIANTPVIVLRTKDHKVKSGAEWFINEGYKSVYFAKSISEAKDIALTILKDKIKVKNENYFNERYFNLLMNEIDGLRGV